MSKKVAASTFREPVLRALGTLTNLTAGVDISFKGEVYPHVLNHMDMGEYAYGEDTTGKPQVQVWMNQAFNKKLVKEGLGAKGSKKGMWTLTPEGVKAAATLLGQTLPSQPTNPETEDIMDTLAATDGVNPSPAAPAAPAPVPATFDGGEGISWQPGEMVNTYNPDPYIRGLAVKQTKCFGEFSSRSDVCGSCPLSGACKAKALTRLSHLAARLRKRDEQAALRKAKGTVAENIDDLDIDEIIDVINSEPEETGTSGNYERIPVPANTKCSGCGKTIEAGTEGLFSRGVGMFHIGCEK